MRSKVKNVIKSLDHGFSHLYLKFFTEKNGLLVFLFHGLFKNEEEISLNHVSPQQSITVEQFRRFVEYYVGLGYEFVSPDDIIKGLKNSGKYVLITFDDGYFSSNLALPVLSEHSVTATFFISMNHILDNKCFWWDVLWRERIKARTPVEEILREAQNLKSRTNAEIESQLKERFGESSFAPLGDIDRPLTISEFKDLAQENTVVLGNHTMDHAILTNYSLNAAQSQIEDAQEKIFELSGIKPSIIAYPNGNYSEEIIRVSRRAGLKIGVTVEQKKNYLPVDLNGDGCMLLGRFILLGNNMRQKMESARSDVAIRRLLGR